MTYDDQDPDDPLPVDVLLRTFDERFGGYRALAVHYVWEDLFRRWKHEGLAWPDRLIRRKPGVRPCPAPDAIPPGRPPSPAGAPGGGPAAGGCGRAARA